MTDVFISYKREERERAARVAEALGGRGYSVWWDAEILPGEQYRAVTLQILDSCRAAIVIWSPASMVSNWVLDEAQRALDRGVLVPVHLEPISGYPLGFGQLQAHNLIGWDGGADDQKFRPVLAAIGRLAGPSLSLAKPSRSAQQAEAEIAFWRGVQDSRDRADLETYLERYADGLFADLARRRLAALAPKQRTAASGKRARAGHRSAAANVEARAQPAKLAAFSEPEGFTRWQLGFIAAAVFAAPFLAWPIANAAVGGVRIFFPPDYAGLLWFGTWRNVYLMVPLLIGLAWLYDRAAAWCAAQAAPAVRLAPAIAVAGLLVIGLFVSVSEEFAAEFADDVSRAASAHLVLWLAAAWAAAHFARAATPWFRARVTAMMAAFSQRSR